jgi:glycosyltransferase involved in cell wall biosynthesis
MKIVLIGNTSWSMYNFRSELIKNLIKSKIRVYVLSPNDSYSSELKKLGADWRNIHISSRGKNPIRELITAYQIYKEVKKIRPDWVINYTIKPVIYGGLAAYLNSIKYIEVITGIGGVFLKEKLLTILITPLYKFALNKSSHVIFLNNSDKDKFLDNKIIDGHNSIILPGEGIDITKFSRINVVNQNKNKSNKKFKVLHAGRLLWDKGLVDLVESVRELQVIGIDVIIHVAGLFNERDDRFIPRNILENWEKEGLVVYRGTFDDIRPLIYESDCVALQSTYGEGVPRILMEAASLEVPILASDIPGCREIVIDGINGYTHIPGSVSSITTQLRRLIELNNNERVKMGKLGRELVESKFSIDKVLELYTKILNEN